MRSWAPTLCCSRGGSQLGSCCAALLVFLVVVFVGVGALGLAAPHSLQGALAQALQCRLDGCRHSR